MKGKIISTLAVVAFCSCPTLGDKGAVLRLHLPRVVRVKALNLQLDTIAIVQGSVAADLLVKARKVTMGRAPVSGERLVISRYTILSRLGALGFNAKAIRFSGTSEVAVMRDEMAIEEKLLIESAEAFLQKTRPGPSKCGWRLTRRPGKLMVPTGEKVNLKSALVDAAPAGYVKVKVSALSGKRKIAQTEVLFKLVYPVRQAVATRKIRSGELITSDNAKIKVTHVESTPRSDWMSPYGMLAARIIPAGRVIRPGMVKTKTLAIVVRRNQRVTMKIEGIGFRVTAAGLALQNGRPGELIKVRNIDSKRIISAEVAFDGTVSPVTPEQ